MRAHTHARTLAAFFLIAFLPPPEWLTDCHRTTVAGEKESKKLIPATVFNNERTDSSVVQPGIRDQSAHLFSPIPNMGSNRRTLKDPNAGVESKLILKSPPPQS